MMSGIEGGATGSSSERAPFSGSLLERPWKWLDARYHLNDVVRFVRHKEVPVGGHSMIWYYFGGIALFFFLIQIATGILLLMYYEAGENTSWESMKYIVGKVPFGWLIRSIHCWSAHLMVVAVLVHMFSVYFLRSYRTPRELTWLSGLGLLALALGFGFSGYLLPWNELSYFATAVGTDSLKSIPVIGQWLLEVLRGGKEVSIRTLHRFFALHVCALPIATFGLVGLHLLLVQRQGMAEQEPSRPGDRLGAMRFFPNFAMRDLLIWVICVNILAILAVLLPHGPGIPGMEWNLGEKADPLKPAYPGIKPEWYFLWIYQMLKEFPSHLFGLEGPQACMLVVTLLLLTWVCVPFLDRGSRRGRPNPAFLDFGISVILFLGFLTLKAWDVGVHAPAGEDPWANPAMAAQINRIAALGTIGLAFAASAFRLLAYRHRTYTFTGIAVLQSILHGFAGMSYLAASGVCTLLFVGAVVFHSRASRRAVAAAALMVGLAGGATSSPAQGAEEPSGDAREHIPESAWPQSFRAIVDARSDAGPIVSVEARDSFSGLPAHAQSLFFAAAESGMLGSPQQLAILLALDLDDRKIELLLSDNCVLCHTNPDMQSEATLFTSAPARKGAGKHMDLREVVSDVHFRKGLMCAGCHGGAPTDDSMSDEIYKRWPEAGSRQKDRTWIPEFCTVRCHAVPEFMRRFNPALPVDQLVKYRESRHGQRLLDMKDSKAAQCVSCHGVHGIRTPESPVSTVNAANIPATCGHCHSDAAYMNGYTLDDGKTPIPTDQLAKYRGSVHGIALLTKHDLGAPACNDCHGNHSALPPDVQQVAQVCRNCHVINGTLFDGSLHKRSFAERGWPECVTCHGKHDIHNANDEMMAVGKPTSICDGCHKDYGTAECVTSTVYFYDGVTQLRQAKERIESAAEELREKGMEVDELTFGASGLTDALLQSRTLIHSFNRSDFARAYESGSKMASQLNQSITALEKEYRFRRNWLGISTFVVTLFALLLYLRVRQADRQGGYRAPEKAPR